MQKRHPGIVIVLIFALLALSLILAGCSLTGTAEDPYLTGQKARTEVDKATEKAGDFVAGFCSATPLPIAALGLVVVLRRARKER